MDNDRYLLEVLSWLGHILYENKNNDEMIIKWILPINGLNWDLLRALSV